MAFGGVHLGQGDLVEAGDSIRDRGALKLGISTHNLDELETALSFNPNYVGFGPIFATQSKETGFDPQGIERLREFVKNCPVPVVAIGGISPVQLDAIYKAGAWAVAMQSHLEGLDKAGLISLIKSFDNLSLKSQLNRAGLYCH